MIFQAAQSLVSLILKAPFVNPEQPVILPVKYKNIAADIPTNGYNEPEVNYQMPDPQQTQSEDARLSLLKALQGRGTGSSADSQKLAQLLQSLGYSK